jgi:predicted transcriptional regulator of viral defense system
MALSFFQFKEALFQQGIFSVNHIRLYFPGFNTDNLLYWQKKGYILRIRNNWYCFKEFILVTDFHYLVANTIYAPSYISHQEALLFYGLIPEHIVDSISITTKKTSTFRFLNRTYKYYSISPKYYFGFDLKEMSVNGIFRNFLIADREKAILDLLYIYDFYQGEQDISEIRFNEIVLETEVNWEKMETYMKLFNNKALEKRIRLIQKIYNL